MTPSLLQVSRFLDAAAALLRLHSGAPDRANGRWKAPVERFLDDFFKKSSGYTAQVMEEVYMEGLVFYVNRWSFWFRPVVVEVSG